MSTKQDHESLLIEKASQAYTDLLWRRSTVWKEITGYQLLFKDTRIANMAYAINRKTKEVNFPPMLICIFNYCLTHGLLLKHLKHFTATQRAYPSLPDGKFN